MKKIDLVTEWLSNWHPTRIQEIADRGCKGLVVRSGPAGMKTFYRWADVRDPATGRSKRKRVKLGHWPALSLTAARTTVNDAKESKRAEVPGGDLTVEQLAQAYSRDRLSGRERGAEEWNTIKVHIVEAQPDPKRPAFGKWPARSVERSDLADVVRIAKVRGLVGSRWRGGPGAARAVLRDLNAIFAHGVEAGLLKTNPAGMKADTFALHKTARKRTLDKEEMRALFKALDLNALLAGTAKKAKLSSAVRFAIAFQLYTPPRSQGILGARWDEIDLDTATWVIPPARQKVQNAAERAQARGFTVPLAPTAVEILRRLKALAGESPWVLPSRRKPAWSLAGKAPTQGSPDEDSKPLSAKALMQALRRLQGSGRLAFGSRVTVHDLRRTWRTLAGELGVAFDVAEACLGHKLAGVAGVYMRGEMVARRREATELVGAALDRIRIGAAAQVVPLQEHSTVSERA